MMLHLGCGDDYRLWWVNLDKNKSFKADIYHDLDNYPYPFKDSTFSIVDSNGVLEHIEDIEKHLHEMHRICEGGAIIRYQVPFANSQNNNTDPTHRHSFTHHSMALFCDNIIGNHKYIKGKFLLRSVEKKKGIIGKIMPGFLSDRLCHVIGEVYSNIVFELCVMK